MDENSEGHIGEFDVDTHEASDWPEELCGARQVQSFNRCGVKRPEMVRTANEFDCGFSVRPSERFNSLNLSPILDTSVWVLSLG